MTLRLLAVLTIAMAISGCQPGTESSGTESSGAMETGQQSQAEPATATRPDFNGIYFPAGFAVRDPEELPYTPAAAELAAAYEAEFRIEDEPGRFCIWPGMPRAPWGAPFPVEVFHRDHDVTIYWEGYGMFRKIYMRDHNPPDPILNTAMGHSVGRWEGDTLVVETTHLRPYPFFRRLATTSDAAVTERIRLETRTVRDEEVTYLVNDITLVDPKLYTQPINLHAEAALRPDLTMLEYTCTNTIWEEYLAEQGLTLPDVDSLPDPGN